MWRLAAKVADVHSATRTKNVCFCCMAVLMTEFGEGKTIANAHAL
jgi:hypothetical protein